MTSDALTTDLPDHDCDLLAPGHWRIRGERSRATFSARGFWGATAVTGTFAGLSGTATLAADGSFDGWLEIPADTLDTALARRDRHLKGADFFDVLHFPEIRFAADGFESTDDRHVVYGELFLHGRSIKLALPVQLVPVSRQRLFLTTEAVFNRDALGLGHSPLGMIRGPAKVHVHLVLERAL